MSYLDELDREIARLKDSLEALETLRVELQGYPAMVDVRIRDLVGRILSREFYVKHAMLHEPGMPDEVWRPAGGVEFDAIVDPKNRLVGASNTPRFRTMTEAVNFGARYSKNSTWTILLADDIKEEALATEPCNANVRHLVIVGVRGGGHYPTEIYTGTTEVRHRRPTWSAPNGKTCFNNAMDLGGWQTITLENLWLTNRSNSSLIELLWLQGTGVPLFLFRTTLEQASTTLPHWRSGQPRAFTQGSVWIESTFLGGNAIYLRGSSTTSRYVLRRNLIKTPLIGMDGTVGGLFMDGNIVVANVASPLLQTAAEGFIITGNQFWQDNAGGSGLRLGSSGSNPLSFVVTGNSFFCSRSTNTGTALYSDWHWVEPLGPFPGTTISGNLISGFGTGIELSLNRGTFMSAVISGNKISARSTGIKLVTNSFGSTGSIIYATVSGNTIINAPTGLAFTVPASSSIEGCFEPNLFLNVATPFSGSPTRSELISNFADITSTAEPPAPPAGYVRLFLNSATGALSVKKPDGTVVNLEA